MIGGPHTVLVRQQSKRDQWGDALPAEEFPLEGVYMVPRSSSEDSSLESFATIGYTLYADRGSRAEEIAPTSQVRWEGVWYEVDGITGKYDWPDGSGAALAVPLKEVR